LLGCVVVVALALWDLFVSLVGASAEEVAECLVAFWS
jgi:hypothetical protein